MYSTQFHNKPASIRVMITEKPLITRQCQKLSTGTCSFPVIVADDECMSSEAGILKLLPFS